MKRRMRPLHTCLLQPLLALLVLAGSALPALAAPAAGPVRLELLDRDADMLLPQYPHRGQRWVAGERGHRYAVRLRNDSDERVLVVLSVDGINAISGEDASPEQTGYVLRPRQTVDIAGWRKSNDEIAQFVFSSPGDSYGARTGRVDNLGVIGIAVFGELRRRPQPGPPTMIKRPHPQARAEVAEAAADASAQARPAMAAPAPAQRLGTGHGERETSQVRDTRFERATLQPTQVSQLRYDSARNLRARGIVTRPLAMPERGPQAFPQRFVPDPPQR